MAKAKKPSARKSRKVAPPTLPRPLGVALPLPATPITTANAAQTTALARWGWGEPNWDVSPDGSVIVLSSKTGLHILDMATLVEVAQVSSREALWGRGAIWAPDGQWLATIGSYGHNAVHLWRWDGTSLVRKKTLKLEDRSYKGPLAFSPDCTVLAFGSMKEIVYLYRVADGEPLGTIEPKSGYLNCIAFSPDSKFLAVFGRRLGVAPPPIQLWPVAGGTPIGPFPVGGFSPYQFGFAPDGSILLANENYTAAVRGWVVSSGRRLDDAEVAALRLPANRCLTSRMATDAEGRLMVARSNQGVSILRPNSTEEALPLRDDREDLLSLHFTPNVTALVSSSDGLLSVAQLPGGSVRVSRQGAVGGISSVAIAPDGATVAVASHGGSSEHWVRFWRLADGTLTGELPGVDDRSRGLVYTTDSTRLLVGSGEAGVSVRHLPDGAEVARLTTGELNCLAVSADGQRMVTGLESGAVQVWDLAAGTLRVTIQAHKGAVSAVAFLPDGAIFSAGTDLWGRLWRSDDGVPIAKMKHGKRGITGAVAPDGRRVVTTCADKRIYLWNASDGREVRAIPAGRSAVQRLAWSPDSNVLASASGSLIQLWNPATGDLLAVLRGHTQDVAALCFSPDGTCLISGGQDETLRVWGLH